MLNYNPERTVRLVIGSTPIASSPEGEPGPWAWPAAETTAVVSADRLLGRSGLRLDDSALRSNQRSIERHVDDDHYLRSFSPGMFVLGGPAGCVHALIPAAAPRWPAVTMPKDLGTNSLAAVSFRKPSEWRSGRLRIRFWFTSPVGSANNFLVQTTVDAIRTSEVLPGTNLRSANTTHAGPAVANTRMFSGDLYTTASFGPDDQSFSLRVARLSTNASDTNANDFNLLEVEVFHISARQEST